MLENVIKTAQQNGCEVRLNALMSEYTTFKTGGKASVIISPKTSEAAAKIILSCYENNQKLLVLGNGSNLLVSDNGFSGVVLRLTGAMSNIEYLGDGVIMCEAGALLSRLCQFALSHNLSGLEFAYGIPGTVGGAVFMNAGAYGGEMKDVLVSAEHIDMKGNFGSFSKDELGLGYRKSVYSSGKYLITKVFLKLKEADYSEIKSNMDDKIKRRMDKQPLEFPSAGSTFKRPDGYYAGALIEQCGLKGFKIGNAQVSEKHAGFVINLGGATTAEILELIDYVKKTVKLQTGVELEMEVKYIEG